MHRSLIKIRSLLLSLGELLHFRRRFDRPSLKRELFNMEFSTPVGLGPGYDGGTLSRALSHLGFSHVCIGPLSVSGKTDMKKSLERVAALDQGAVHAIEISSAIENATEDEIAKDYLNTFTRSYDYASFFILDFYCNSSGINMELSYIQTVTNPILEARIIYDTYKPILLSLPDSMSGEDMAAVLDYCRLSGIDGIVSHSVSDIRFINKNSCGRFPVIGRCRFSTGKALEEMLEAGASLVEMTGDTLAQGIIAMKPILNRL